MDTEQVTEVTVHMLDGGAEFAVPVRLGAELTREGWLRVRREEALARGDGRTVMMLEEEICYAERGTA